MAIETQNRFLAQPCLTEMHRCYVIDTSKRHIVGATSLRTSDAEGLVGRLNSRFNHPASAPDVVEPEIQGWLGLYCDSQAQSAMPRMLQELMETYREIARFATTSGSSQGLPR